MFGGTSYPGGTIYPPTPAVMCVFCLHEDERGGVWVWVHLYNVRVCTHILCTSVMANFFAVDNDRLLGRSGVDI